MEWVVAPALALSIIVYVLPGKGGPVDPSTIVAPERFADLRREFAPVDFAVLAGFEYGEPTNVSSIRRSVPPGRIPGYVQALSGTKVAVSGFMLPLDFDGEGVTTFLLNASFDMCYFGAPVQPNQFIVVRMKDGRRTRFVHTPVVVFGVLTVSEERRDGRIVSLYRMDADGVGFGAR
jgi:hypothetical protein